MNGRDQQVVKRFAPESGPEIASSDDDTFGILEQLEISGRGDLNPRMNIECKGFDSEFS